MFQKERPEEKQSFLLPSSGLGLLFSNKSGLHLPLRKLSYHIVVASEERSM